MFQAAVIGGTTGILIWVCILLIVCERFLLEKKNLENETAKLSEEKKNLENETAKLSDPNKTFTTFTWLITKGFFTFVVISTSFFIIPVFSKIFDLWVKTDSNVEQSLDLLRTITSMGVTLAIGSFTAYIASQQYFLQSVLVKKQLEQIEDQKLKDVYEELKSSRLFKNG